MTWGRASAGLALLLAACALAAVLALHGPAADAAILRTIPLDGTPDAIVVDPHAGRAFITAANDSRVRVLDTRSGRILRTVSVGTAPLLGAVDTRRGRIYVGDRWDNVVHVLDARSGRILHTVTLPADPNGSLEVAQAMAVDERTGYVYVASSAGSGATVGNVSTLTGTGERLVHTIMIDAAPFTAAAVDSRGGRVLVVGYSGSGNMGSMIVLDRRTGRVVRSVPVAALPGALAVDDLTGRAFAPNPVSTGVDVVDTRRGTLLRTVRASPAAFSQMMAVDSRSGQVFVVTGRGISAVSASTGALQFTSGIAGYLQAVAVDERAGHVLVSVGSAIDRNGTPTGTGRVCVLNARNGAVLRMIPVGAGPGAIAVDEGSGHAFVLNGGGLVPAPDVAGWVPAWLRRWLPFLPRPGSGTRTVGGSVTMLDAARR